MSTQSRTYRAMATLAAAVLGLGAAVLGGTAAYAAEDLAPYLQAVPGCSGTNLLFAADPAVDWTITAGGETVFPLDGDVQPGDLELAVVHVPFGSGEITVTYESAPAPDWPQVFPDGEPAAECASVPEPEVTQPTCETPAQIVIPEYEAFEVIFQDELFDDDAFFQLDGVEVPYGSTQELTPGPHTVTIVDTAEQQKTYILREWVFTIDEPECPTQAPSDTPTENAGQANTGLANTGANTGPMLGVAAVLTVLGFGLFLAGRRRRAG